ncbi:MAG TPA: hypothetical protein VMW87_10550 [Spirochaetia bacterium]|nr:hypothetical protein [Spirochaetia bacterium]
MNATKKMGSFKEALQLQGILLDRLSHEEARLQIAVLQKDWIALEACVREMKSLSAGVEECETRRNESYRSLKTSLGLKSGDSFYDVLARLPIDERQELVELYRRLRIGIAKVRSITDGIDAYVTATVGTMRDILDELFPERKGKLYSRTGAAASTDTSSMVVNHRL